MSQSNHEFILAHCGLVCSNCGMYRKGRCQGCHSDKPMYRGCKVKKCCLDRQLGTCAECDEFVNLRDCRKLHNWVSRIFAFIFRTNRIGNLYRIREVGVDEFRQEVTAASDR